MGEKLAALAIIAYLPGTLLFRWPSAGRSARAALPAEERVFWGIILSLIVSCMLVLTLAAAGVYTFGRLVGLDLLLSLILAASAKGNLRLGPPAAPVGLSALPPVLLVAVGLWLYFPPAEWVLGGRDPGVYTVEGVQIAQRGSLITRDALVAAVPEHLRDLVFPIGVDGRSQRFLGFFILDAPAGTVVGQFPQLYPASLALGYGIDGLTGVRRTTGVWAILGVLAVYFAGTIYFGKPVAAAAAGLLSLNVAQVWFGRTPNAEVAFQALVFSGLCAHAHMERTGSRFFALAAATLLGTLLFLRIDGFIVLAAVAGAVFLGSAAGRRVPAMFVVPLVAWAAAGTAYLAVVVPPYFDQPKGFVQNLTATHWALVAAGIGVMAVFATVIRRIRVVSSPARWPLGVVVAVVAAALYSYFLREPSVTLAAHDAHSLRSFAAHYLTPYLLAAALLGYVIVGPRMLGKNPLFVVLATTFCMFFFYKIRIVPEHFWMARRFLPVVLPAMLLFAAAAAFDTPRHAARPWRMWLLRARAGLGVVVAGAAGWHFLYQTRPILSHVEYADVIPRVERLAAQVGDDDLVIMESRGSSDLHVLGPPLAYIYDRRVLALTSDRPDTARFDEFIEWAARHYRRVLYFGSGGMALLSRTVDAEFIASEEFAVPEYDRQPDGLPTKAGRKDFAFGRWQFGLEPRVVDHVRVEVGGVDDFAVAGFWAKERNERFRFRWSTERAELRFRLPAAAPSGFTLWMGNGGRPPGVPVARVSVYLDDQFAGTADVTSPEPQPFGFPIQPDALERAAARDGFITVRLETSTWNPKTTIGSPDPRDLGVMVMAAELR